MLRAWWARAPKPGNVGDIITPVLLERLGIPVEWATPEKAQLLATGSIIGKALARHTVWGSGAMTVKATPHPSARYLAVRGPLTAAVVRKQGGTCPDVYGDPAMLLPLVHNDPVEPRYDVGVVPHYVDTVLVDPERHEVVINPLRENPLDVVDEIRACRAIVSSSLHGIVIAHAYGIPAAWVRLSDGLNGDDTKFHDHAASVGVKLIPYRTIDEAIPVLGSLDTRPLLDALDALR